MKSNVFRMVLFAGMLPTAAFAQSETGRFVLMQGGDSAIVEKFTRTAGQLTSEIVQRAGGRITFTARLAPDASVEHLELSVSQNGQTQSATFAFKGDTAFVEQSGNTRRIGIKAGTVPTLPVSFALFEQVLLRGAKIGGAAPNVPITRVMQERMVWGTVTRPTPDSAFITVDNTAPLRFKVDARGYILGGTSGNTGAVIVRVP